MLLVCALHGSGVCPSGVGTQSDPALEGFLIIKEKYAVSS
jgi:hypothetical protein